ncbi:MAG: hypothetical protein Q9163_005830, partial [Psora crenata]
GGEIAKPLDGGGAYDHVAAEPEALGGIVVMDFEFGHVTLSMVRLVGGNQQRDGRGGKKIAVDWALRALCVAIAFDIYAPVETIGIGGAGSGSIYFDDGIEVRNTCVAIDAQGFGLGVCGGLLRLWVSPGQLSCDDSQVAFARTYD